jgi:hypothetical protein
MHRNRPAASLKTRGLLNCVRQGRDLASDVGAQQLESGYGSERDQSGCHCVFRKFKTCLIAEKSLNHFVAPFSVYLVYRCPASPVTAAGDQRWMSKNQE